jgi:hypothetical protein
MHPSKALTMRNELSEFLKKNLITKILLIMQRKSERPLQIVRADEKTKDNLPRKHKMSQGYIMDSRQPRNTLQSLNRSFTEFV